MLQGPRVGVVDRLSQQPLGVGDEGSDHVDQLGQAGEVDPVGVAQEGVDGPPDEQRVLQVVDLLEEPGRFLPPPAPPPLAVPHVPLVEGQEEALLRLLAGPHVVADRRHFLDLPVHLEVQAEEPRGVRGGLVT